MIVYSTLAAAMAAEPGLHLLDDGQFAPAGRYERDWGYRLRGGGLPGGEVGWLLTFAGQGAGMAPSEWGPKETGWLIAYEIAHSSKTGRVAILRRDWDSGTDWSELHRVHASSALWDARNQPLQGEADLDDVDANIAGTQL